MAITPERAKEIILACLDDVLDIHMGVSFTDRTLAGDMSATLEVSDAPVSDEPIIYGISIT